SYVFFFFFQAEDGIRDFHVTGVQTCALPISGDVAGGDRPPARRPVRPAARRRPERPRPPPDPARRDRLVVEPARRAGAPRAAPRSEERRVGKEWRCGGSPHHEKRKLHKTSSK